MNAIQSWAARWNIPPAAIDDLARALTPLGPTPHAATNEATVQSLVRLQASESGWLLLRNNVGACYTKEGGFLRYGLANESKRMNDSLKSSDLIGIRPVVIDPTHLGRTIGQFVAVECKHSGWTYADTKRDQAQQRFLTLVESVGGYGQFSTGVLGGI